VGSLDLYNFNEIISGTPLKNRKKKWGHFLKMDIFKMSIFENLGVNVSQKVILLGNDLNTKKIILKLL
jgi:hypothetical protein